MPGAVSLAHRGVLFLDEMTEFKRNVLDMLRQPLEDKKVQLTRTYGTVAYPADFMLVGAMNPCPCGYYPDENRCRCTDAQIQRYLSHISGPLLDRMDICVEMQKTDTEKLLRREKGENSQSIRKRVAVARGLQQKRFSGSSIRFNSEMGSRELDKYCHLDEVGEKRLQCAAETFGLSIRACHRIVRVARTIADLEGEERINAGHISEAVYYRTAAGSYWERRG